VTKTVVTVNEEHKSEELHEAQTMPTAAVNDSGKSDDAQTETTDETKTKEKGGKSKGFMGFLKSKTRSQSKDREQATEKAKDQQKPKTEAEEDDGSKKGDSLEREHKQFKIGLFSKKSEEKKPDKEDTATDVDKDAEKHKTSKFSLFGKKKDKPSEESDEQKGESKDEQAVEATANVEESQSKPKEKKWFHFGKKSSKETAVVGDAHPYEEPAKDAEKDDEDETTEKDATQEPEPETAETTEPEKLEQEEKTTGEGEEEATKVDDVAASQEAEVDDSQEAAAADVEITEDAAIDIQTEEKEELHAEEKQEDVSPGGTLTSETDNKDAKGHKKFSFGIKFGKKQKVAKSESTEDNKAIKENVSTENETPKHEQSSEPPKDEEGAKQKKQKLFSFGRLTKSKSKDESDVKVEKHTEELEQKAEEVVEIETKDEKQQEEQILVDAAAEAGELKEEKHVDVAVETNEVTSEEIKTEVETSVAIEKTETETEIGQETAEGDKKEDTTAEAAAKDEATEQEVKKEKKDAKKFSFGFKFGQKKDEKTEDEASEETAQKQKETKWSPFSKKPAKKASDEPAKVEDEANKEDVDQSDKTVAETGESSEAKDVVAEAEKTEEIKETKEEKTINIRLPKLFSFGKKEALAEDRNIAQESKEGVDGAEATAEAEAEKDDEGDQTDKQTEGEKKEGSKMSVGIRKFFSMGKREKEGETKQEEAVATEENKDEEAKVADAEQKSSPETKHRQRSKSPHKKFPFEIKFGKKKEKSEPELIEKEAEVVEAGATSEVEVKDSETAAESDVQTESAAKETNEVQETDRVSVEEEVVVATSKKVESVPVDELMLAADVEAAEAEQKPDNDGTDKPAEAESTPATSDSAVSKPPTATAATRGRRFPFGFMFGRRSERAKSAERSVTTAATDDVGAAAVGTRTEKVKTVMETSASVPDVHLHATTNYEDSQPTAEHNQPKPEEAVETTETEIVTKSKDSHVHRGIKWPHFGGKKTQKQDETKEKEADGMEKSEVRQTSADDSQVTADDKDASTPKSKKSLLGKGIFRIFSPRSDLQKSMTMDGNEEVISYSVEGEGQIMASDTDWRSNKTASLDSKGRIPKSATTGADRSEMVAVVADSVTDTGRCDVDGDAVSSHLVVVAIDFGTTYSGYAFSFAKDAPSAANQIHMMRRWEGGDPGVVNQKTPTTILLTPSKQFHSFGFTARDFYHDLDQAEANRWLYFEKFKMKLHQCTVRDLPLCFTVHNLCSNYLHRRKEVIK